MAESDERRTCWKVLDRNLSFSCHSLFQITNYTPRSIRGRIVVATEFVSLESSTRAVVSSSSRVYVAYALACIMQESNGPRSRDISPPPIQAQMYSPNYLRIVVPPPRVPRRTPQLFPLLLSIFAGAFTWNAFI